MSIDKILNKSPPLQDTNITCESIAVGPTGSALTNYQSGSFIGSFGLSGGTGWNTGLTGLFTYEIIGNICNLNIPNFNSNINGGSTGATLYLTLPAVITPASSLSQLNCSSLLFNGNSGGVINCAVELTSGLLIFTTANNNALTGSGFQILQQTITYRLF